MKPLSWRLTAVRATPHFPLFGSLQLSHRVLDGTAFAPSRR